MRKLKQLDMRAETLYKRGYEFIKTPAVEYFDTVGKASAIADAHLFKLVDSQGNTLVFAT